MGGRHISSTAFITEAAVEPEILMWNQVERMERKHILILRMMRQSFIDGRSWDA